MPRPEAPKVTGSKFQAQPLGSENRGCLEPEVDNVFPGVYTGCQ